MSKTSEITNTENIIDSRDVIERIKALEDDRSLYTVDTDETPFDESLHWKAEDGTVLEDTWTEDEEDELRKLKALEEEASGYAPDWRYGEALVHEDHFEDYARQLAEAFGMMKDENIWPYTCIDWEKAADELKQDYTSVDFDGQTYWLRS